MHSSPGVIVNKSGPITALVKGVFSVIIVAIICVSVLGFAGLRTVDHQFTEVRRDLLGSLPEIIRALPDWRESLPPQVAEALDDRRALDYIDNLDIAGRFESAPSEFGDRGQVVITVTNNGTETVSLLTLRLLAEDESPEFARQNVVVASPLSFIEDLEGPLLAGSTRKILVPIHEVHGDLNVILEPTELRVWNQPSAPSTTTAEPVADAAM